MDTLVKHYGSWAFEDCTDCGENFQITRTQERSIAVNAAICNDCEIYSVGYKEGQEHALADIKRQLEEAYQKGVKDGKEIKEGVYTPRFY